MSKYKAKRTEVDGVVFASKAEARRYGELKLMQQAGAISELVLQPRFPLVVNGHKVGEYRGDFSYWDEERGRAVLEDVKSPATVTPIYRLKKKMVRAIYDVEIEEVYA